MSSINFRKALGAPLGRPSSTHYARYGTALQSMIVPALRVAADRHSATGMALPRPPPIDLVKVVLTPPIKKGQWVQGLQWAGHGEGDGGSGLFVVYQERVLLSQVCTLNGLGTVDWWCGMPWNSWI